MGEKRTPVLRAESVYRALRRAIIEQALKPGMKLPEDSIGEQLGVSRTLVREAFGRLAVEGLVELKPNRGASVAYPTLEEARDQMGLGAMPAAHPQWLGLTGMHGHVAPNRAVHEADIIIAVGSRFSDRVTGDLKRYPAGKTVIHLDIDRSEVDKNVATHIALVGELKPLLALVADACEAGDIAAWTAAVVEAIPSGGRTGVPVAGPDRDSAVDIAYITGSVACQELCSPSAPKSVTDIVTRCSNRSANAAHEVPNAAAWPVA